ncbi:DAN domain family member 5 [Denticeps clupeoides]|uniref:DAN domain family member 5 n=1 Tax=Denticeps clupeoides TaxID=299321 RepID=UPI0010A44235|nr:DAN domain family member 5-like [Denticeps clupeoides]
MSPRCCALLVLCAAVHAFPRGDAESSASGPDVPARGRGAFPRFLALGRPALGNSHHDQDRRRRLGMSVWQRAAGRGDQARETVAMPAGAAETRCAAVPFMQRVTATGCESVTVPNKLCFGQCTSMFVPPGGDPAPDGHRSVPCSRCGPSRTRLVSVPLRCGHQVRRKSLMLVEECKCETGLEKTADSGF